MLNQISFRHVLGAMLAFGLAAPMSAADGSAVTPTAAPHSYRNPVLPGFYPDPSVCKVGDTYYLANSSFEYFPAIPIHASKDLVGWKLIGHAIDRPGQLDLSQAQAFGGVWAPTIRHHNGVFYLVSTNTRGKGNFLVTATDPAGPWSDPVFFTEMGFDPSIFFDDDGRVIITIHEGGKNGRILQNDYDLPNNKWAGEWRELWKGTGGIWPEGPHLVKKDGWYYLIIAEGGTGYGHGVQMARSRDPYGPYEPNPANPLLSHAGKPEHPIQATGHGDFVQGPDGSWWLVYLGFRPQGGKFHHLGRETFLSPIDWPEGEWPRLKGAEGAELELPAAQWMGGSADAGFADDFKGKTLDPRWNVVRNTDPAIFKLKKGKLLIPTGSEPLTGNGNPHWLGVRQRHFRARFGVTVDFRAKDQGQEAGLNIRMNENFQAVLGLSRKDGKPQLHWRKVLGGKLAEESWHPVPKGPVRLQIEAREEQFRLGTVLADGSFQVLAQCRPQEFAKEVAGGFAGLYFGLFATRDAASPTRNAGFWDVEYAQE